MKFKEQFVQRDQHRIYNDFLSKGGKMWPYVFGAAKIPLQNEAEGVIEKFEYLP